MIINLINKELKEIFIKYLNLELSYFSRFSFDGDNIILISELHLDLLDEFELIKKIENRFSILLETDILEKYNTFYLLSKHIYELLNERR